MLLRDRKANDENHGKWIGVGGKMETGESPHECVVREVREETGLTLTRYRLRGVISFISDLYEDEYMMLFDASDYTGTLREDCDEGTLRWVREEEVMDLRMWEGDRLFLPRLLHSDEPVHMKLVYRGDNLIQSETYA